MPIINQTYYIFTLYIRINCNYKITHLKIIIAKCSISIIKNKVVNLTIQRKDSILPVFKFHSHGKLEMEKMTETNELVLTKEVSNRIPFINI